MPANDAVNSCFHEINWKLDGASLSGNEKNTSFYEAAVLFENYARFLSRLQDRCFQGNIRPLYNNK